MLCMVDVRLKLRTAFEDLCNKRDNSEKVKHYLLSDEDWRTLGKDNRFLFFATAFQGQRVEMNMRSFRFFLSFMTLLRRNAWTNSEETTSSNATKKAVCYMIRKLREYKAAMVNLFTSFSQALDTRIHNAWRLLY